jgi:AcrR family transcriptional regulator
LSRPPVQRIDMAGARLATSAARVLGVASEAKNGRDRLLDRAIDLFYANGFHSVGLDNILDAAGVTKTTFYKHFESKDDLVVAAIQRRDEWESQAWGRAVQKLAGDDPRKQLLAMLDVMDLWFNDPDFGGCMFINAAAEYPNPNDPVHQAAAAYKRKARHYRREQALAAGAAPANAEAFADIYMALLEGALILRQTQARNDAAKAIRPAVEQLMRTYLQ